MRKFTVIVTLLVLTGLGAGYTVAQDQPATPATYLVDCSTPASGVIASPDTLTDPAAEATTSLDNQLLELDASPQATPGQFECEAPDATPAA